MNAIYHFSKYSHWFPIILMVSLLLSCEDKVERQGGFYPDELERLLIFNGEKPKEKEKLWELNYKEVDGKEVDMQDCPGAGLKFYYSPEIGANGGYPKLLIHGYFQPNSPGCDTHFLGDSLFWDVIIPESDQDFSNAFYVLTEDDSVMVNIGNVSSQNLEITYKYKPLGSQTSVFLKEKYRKAQYD